MTSPFSPVLETDHIDLLVSAALTWGVFAGVTTTEAAASALAAAATGQLLREENFAALQSQADRGRGRIADRATRGQYRFTPVNRLHPVEVIKAAHAAEWMCAPSPTWDGSPARHLLTAILTAACHRLDGYADAPWNWVRPERYSIETIAVGGQWRPPLAGAVWLELDELHDRWEHARTVVITSEVAGQVPPDLPARPGLILLAKPVQPVEEVWHAIAALDLHAHVMFWSEEQAGAAVMTAHDEWLLPQHGSAR